MHIHPGDIQKMQDAARVFLQDAALIIAFFLHFLLILRFLGSIIGKQSRI